MLYYTSLKMSIRNNRETKIRGVRVNKLRKEVVKEMMIMQLKEELQLWERKVVLVESLKKFSMR
jgi:hypothetical protein